MPPATAAEKIGQLIAAPCSDVVTEETAGSYVTRRLQTGATVSAIGTVSGSTVTLVSITAQTAGRAGAAQGGTGQSGAVQGGSGQSGSGQLPAGQPAGGQQGSTATPAPTTASA